MAPSNNSRAHRLIVGLDRAALCGLAMGLAMYVAPFWREGRLRWAFWLTLGSTLLHVYTSHKRSSTETSGSPTATRTPAAAGQKDFGS